VNGSLRDRNVRVPRLERPVIENPQRLRELARNLLNQIPLVQPRFAKLSSMHDVGLGEYALAADTLLEVPTEE